MKESWHFKYILEKCKQYYEWNSTGGNLHIVLDDGSMEKCHVEWCLDQAKKEGDTEGAELAALLLGISERARFRLYDRYEYYSGGYVGVGG